MKFVLQTFTVAYDAQEDRILVAIDIETASSWSCWLTRRLTLAFLNRASEYMDRTSPWSSKTAVHSRQDLAAFELDAALEATASATRNTGAEPIDRSKSQAELAESITLQHLGELFRINLQGTKGGAASGDLSRPILQRLMKMLADEASRARWLEAAVPVAEKDDGDLTQARWIRH